VKKPSRYILFIFFILSRAYLNAQNNANEYAGYIDSLKKTLAGKQNDTTRAKTFFSLIEIQSDLDSVEFYKKRLENVVNAAIAKKGSREYYVIRTKWAEANFLHGQLCWQKGKIKDALHLHEAGLKIAEEINNKFDIYNGRNGRGYILCRTGKIDEGLKDLRIALQMQEEMGDEESAARSLSNIGIVLRESGRIKEAMDCFTKSLKLNEKLGLTQQIGGSYSNFAIVYQMQGQHREALEYFLKSLKIFEDTKLNYGIGTMLNNAGNCYLEMHDYAKALDYFERGRKMREKAGDINGLGITLSNIGITYRRIGKPEKAREYFDLSIKKLEEGGDLDGMAGSLLSLAELELASHHFNEAKILCLKAKEMATKVQSLQNLILSELYLSRVDSANGDFKNAVIHYKTHLKFADSLSNTETQKRAVQQQMNYEFEKRTSLDETRRSSEAEKQKVIAEEKKRKQNIINLSIGCGLVLVLLIALFIYRSYRTKQKTNEELAAKNHLIEKQKKHVEEKQQEIIDSITYARRIQRAFMTNEKFITKKLNELQS
jgi:tetratricopeptide (TPR) repeat protein